VKGDGESERTRPRKSTHRSPNQLQQIVLQPLPLRPRKIGLAHAAPLGLQPIEVRDTRLGEGGELVDALTEVGYSVMSVEVDEILELAVDDPFHGAVTVLEFDPEDGVAVVEGVEGVGDLELWGW
jgi:hypothetical protein